MKRMYLTKEGVLTEEITQVYISNDEKYYNLDNNIVNVYNIFGIKDIDNIIPKELEFNCERYKLYAIDGFDMEIFFENVDDEDILIYFEIKKDLSFDINDAKFMKYNKLTELWNEFN